MNKGEEKNDSEYVEIVVNGKCVRLFFLPEPNMEAAAFIKKTLMSAYTLKAV